MGVRWEGSGGKGQESGGKGGGNLGKGEGSGECLPPYQRVIKVEHLFFTQ